MAPRSAAQPATQSAGTTRRSTRQQSKEPEAATTAEASTAPATTTSRNRGGRHSRENSTEDALVVGGGAGGARKQGTRRQNLDTVPEQETHQDAAPNDQPDANAEVDADAQAVTTENSRLSGATAVEANLPEDEGSELRNRGIELVRNLSDLAQLSSSILGFITTPAETPEAVKAKLAQILKADSIQNQVLKADELDLTNYTGGNPYIHVGPIVSSLLKSINPPSRGGREDYRPDNILYKLNLASLTKTILPLTKESPDLHEKLLLTYQCFPHELSPFTIAAPLNPAQRLEGNVLVSAETFGIVLELRTQYVKQVLRQLPAGADPRPAFNEIWHAPDRDPLKEYWGISKEREANYHSTPDRIERVNERADKFNACFSTQAQNFAVDHAQLEQEFPWSSFLEQLLAWTGKMYRELDRKLADSSGTDEIIKKLKDKVIPPPPPAAPISIKAGLKNINNRLKKEKTPKSTPKSTAKSPARGRGRPKKGQAGDVQGEEQPRAELEPLPPADPNIDPTLQDPATLEIATKATALAAKADALVGQDPQERNLIEQLNAHNNNMGAAGSVLNPQTGATKVAFNEDMTQASTHASVEEIPPNPYVQSSSDVQPTQDTGFGSQKQGTKRSAGASTKGRASKRARTTKELVNPDAVENPADETYQDKEDGGNDAESPSKKGKSVHAQPVPSDWAPRPSDYRSVNQQAKTVQAVHGRKPQPKRRPWEIKETDALIDYIEQYGTSWSYIKAVDKDAKWLIDRSQVDLKDKARNMKMDYLKSGVALPMNFETIQLDRKATIKLATLGIDYSQTPRRQSRAREVATTTGA